MQRWQRWVGSLLGTLRSVRLSVLRWIRRTWLRSTRKPYSGRRMHAVRRLARGWGDSAAKGNRHPLAKPDWVKSVVLQLASDLPQAGCRTLANSFNLAHCSSKLTVSKTWVAKLLKARAAAVSFGTAQIEAYWQIWRLQRANSTRLGH